MSVQSRCLTSCAGVLVAVLLGGCSSNKDAVEKKLSDLRAEITRLQNSQDRLAERVMAVEINAEESARAKPVKEPERLTRPPLKVVHLSPYGDEDPPQAEPKEPADDSSPRPVLRARGKEAGVGEERARRSEKRQDRD